VLVRGAAKVTCVILLDDICSNYPCFGSNESLERFKFSVL